MRMRMSKLRMSKCKCLNLSKYSYHANANANIRDIPSYDPTALILKIQKFSLIEARSLKGS